MLNKQLIEDALNEGADFGDVHALMANTSLRLILTKKRLELVQELLNLDYGVEAELMRVYKDKRRQLSEIDDFLTFRDEFLKEQQQPQV